MRLAICDDESKCLQEYQQTLAAIFEKRKIAAAIVPFRSCNELMFALEDEAGGFDVIFLDIHMPGMDGMEMARWLREKQIPCEIVFLTVSQSHMLHAFDVGAFHYIVKGITSREKVEEICLRVAEQVGKRKREVITVSCAGESRVIPVADILYFEVQNYIIIVHYGQISFEFYSTLGKIENSLAGHGFVRTHRSYLVNLRHVHAVMRQELELSNGAKIPVGRKYTEELRLLMRQRSEEQVTAELPEQTAPKQ